MPARRSARAVGMAKSPSFGRHPSSRVYSLRHGAPSFAVLAPLSSPCGFVAFAMGLRPDELNTLSLNPDWSHGFSRPGRRVP
ncbi:Os08g0212475 [Oryza sativa Japonica Group]|uniref:Os08g0212475 protein n=1 Tax=Oryza sativa subsp. japonica TaxID=39947 RepID=A0A0P0XD39_ORYSJ|nr:Os08g0212475 [Oryza sativa Japonica Group]